MKLNKLQLLATASAVAMFTGLVTSDALANIIRSNAGDSYTLGGGYTQGTEGVVAPSGAAIKINRQTVWDASGVADWISFANTGATVEGGGTPASVTGNIKTLTGTNNQNDRTIGNHTALFTDSFTVGHSTNDTFFRGKVWADDTATVRIVNKSDNSVVYDFAAFQGQIDPCAPGYNNGPVGCVSSAGLFINQLLNPGNYELRVYAYQTNANVFGAKWDAVVTPIPAALPMLGAAIAGLGFAGWRKRKAGSV